MVRDGMERKRRGERERRRWDEQEDAGGCLGHEEMRWCRSSSEMTWGVDTSDTSNKHAGRRGEGVVPYGPVKALPIAIT